MPFTFHYIAATLALASTERCHGNFLISRVKLLRSNLSPVNYYSRLWLELARGSSYRGFDFSGVNCTLVSGITKTGTRSEVKS